MPPYAMLAGMAKSGGSTRKSVRQEPQRAMRPRAVAEMLPDVGGAAFRRFGFVQSSIVSRWREIVGERYAGVSAPESIRFPPGSRSGGVLNLVVEGAHAAVMQHVAPEIVERVNRFFGYQAVIRVRFRQGLVQLARKAQPPRTSAARPVPAELGESLREVADPELRACLEALARSLPGREGVATIPVIGKVKG